MNDSILDTIKQMLGLPADYDPFDVEIINHINSAIATLTQYGVGPPEGFSISDRTTTWEELLGEGRHALNLCREFIFMYVKSVWDSSASGTIANAMKERMKELEYRIILEAEVGG